MQNNRAAKTHLVEASKETVKSKLDSRSAPDPPLELMTLSNEEVSDS